MKETHHAALSPPWKRVAQLLVKHFCALYLCVFSHSIAPAAFSACLCSAPGHPKPQLLTSSVLYPLFTSGPPAGQVPAAGRGGHFAGGGAGAALAAARWRPCAARRRLALASWRWAACLRPVLSFMSLGSTAHGVLHRAGSLLHRAGSLDTCLYFSLACSKPLSSSSSVFPLTPYVLTSAS